MDRDGGEAPDGAHTVCMPGLVLSSSHPECLLQNGPPVEAGMRLSSSRCSTQTFKLYNHLRSLHCTYLVGKWALNLVWNILASMTSSNTSSTLVAVNATIFHVVRRVSWVLGHVCSAVRDNKARHEVPHSFGGVVIWYMRYT